MKIFFGFVLLMCITSGSSYAQTNIKELDKSVVLIIGISNGKAVSSGSGFVVSKEVVVTNHHVGERNELIVLTPRVQDSIKAYKTTKIWSSKEYDLQFLRVPNLPLQPLPVAVNELKKGQEVIAIGYPAVADDDVVSHNAVESTVSKGIVGRILQGTWYENRPQFSLIQHNATINRGNSGGPLLDLCGRVVGVNTRKAISEVVVTRAGGAVTSQTEGIFFASGGKILSDLLDQNSLTHTNKSTPCESTPLGLASTNTSYLSILGIFSALFLGGLAVFLTLKKNQAITETYTQFIRRKESKDKKANENSTKGYLLKGADSIGRKIHIRLDGKFTLGSEITVGRDDSSRICLDDPTVSRLHAVIKISSNGIGIKDLGSTNGTYVDSNRISDNYQIAMVGQKILFGSVELVLAKE